MRAQPSIPKALRMALGFLGKGGSLVVPTGSACKRSQARKMFSHAETFGSGEGESLNLIKRLFQSPVRKFAQSQAKQPEMGLSLDTIREMAFGTSAHAREDFLKA